MDTSSCSKPCFNTSEWGSQTNLFLGCHICFPQRLSASGLVRRPAPAALLSAPCISDRVCATNVFLSGNLHLPLSLLY